MSPPAPLHDLLGIGFGPSNLALAAGLCERRESTGRGLGEVRFLERRSSFGRHPGMMFEHARLQVSFLKDLATPRDPKSRFTFLNYLWSRGRLDEFVNLNTFRPTRLEYTDYFRWAADQLGDLVHYDREVVTVTPVTENGRVTALDVTAQDSVRGETVCLRARNVVLAAGGTPYVPEGVPTRRSGPIFHSAAFLPRIRADYTELDRPYKFVVVGEGQSAAEIFEHLIERYPNAAVTAAMRAISYRPMDDSPFVNEVFFPRMVDTVYELAPARREAVLAELRNTNYSVADLDLIERLYQRLYTERLLGRRELRVVPCASLVGAQEQDGGVRATFHESLQDRELTLEADALILATGYRTPRVHPLLEQLAPWFEPDEAGGPSVSRDYRVRTRDDFEPGVYLQGYCGETHGIADTLLSLAAVRAADIIRSLEQRVLG